ncbi:hypothetical protein C2E23DRAFT_857987 [Lenzites betulinus]|nr:hypothetical protein C2E23DRAFT_857987 [Lenzites betulinus]
MASRAPWPRNGPLLAAIPYAALAAAYSFNFKSAPRQCENLELEITGAGSPPYSALIIPFGASPLPNQIEARRITPVAFNGSDTSASFQLKFPENSQFVAVTGRVEVQNHRQGFVHYDLRLRAGPPQSLMSPISSATPPRPFSSCPFSQASVPAGTGSLTVTLVLVTPEFITSTARHRSSSSSRCSSLPLAPCTSALTPPSFGVSMERCGYVGGHVHHSHVSDSTGFGTGGTSAAVEVLSGTDGCFNTTQSVSPAFLFHTDPSGLLITCDSSRIWWDANSVQGSTTFQGVIPGGQSFQIPQGQTSNVTGEGVGFNWTPSVRVGTTVLLVGGDQRGLGSAGSNFYTMQEGNTSSCLNDTSPSSTPGTPAGGSYPTSTDGSGVDSGSGSGGSSTNVGAIVGGVIGGVVAAIALGLVLLFAVRRKRFHKGTKERPVDLLQDQDNEGGDARPPEYYQPDPFVLPDPTIASTHDAAGSVVAPGLATRPSAEQRQSYLSTSTSETGGPGAAYLRAPASSAPSTSTRKSAAPPTFRPVNIIQHDDAGPSDPPPPPPEEEPETIELPPAYTNIRRVDVAAPAEGAAGEGEAGAGAAPSGSPPVSAQA